jgi:hypothetical protein
VPGVLFKNYRHPYLMKTLNWPIFIIASSILLLTCNTGRMTTTDIEPPKAEPEINYELVEELFSTINEIYYSSRQRSAKALINRASLRELNFIDQKSGKTLLHLASQHSKYKGVKEIIELLIEKGADVDTQDHNGNSFLTLIIENVMYQSYQPLIEKALKASKNLNQQNTAGKTYFQVLEGLNDYQGVAELQDLIKYKLHLSVDSVFATHYDNRIMHYRIRFSESLSESSVKKSNIRIVNSQLIDQSFQINKISPNLIDFAIPNFNLSNRYFLIIPTSIESITGRSLMNEHFAQLEYYSIFTEVDSFALSASITDEANTEILSSYLTNSLNDTLDKIRAIYVWITDRIAYDPIGMINPSRQQNLPEVVLQNRKAVCQGYAELFDELCYHAGITSTIVAGHGKGAGYESGRSTIDDANHAWNVVWFDKQWHFIETTWGAGYVNMLNFHKQFTNHYFFTPPEVMITSHFPTFPEWQLLAKPTSFAMFDEYISQTFSFRHGIIIVSPLNKSIRHEGSSGIHLLIPDNQKIRFMCDQDFSVNQNNYTWEIHFQNLTSEKFDFRIFARNFNDVNKHYTHILDYELEGKY